jgi:L-ascorbate metabolism protein UlaG (beta-lactamase superfamily)
MKLTKYSHSCLRIADGDRRLVIDPGVYSETAEALTDIDAVLVTHQHADHVDALALTAAARQNRYLRIWGPPDIIDQLGRIEALAGRLTAVGPEETFIAGGFPVRTYGGQHALIHSTIPVVSNIGYLVADAVYHPGDSFSVPNAVVEALLIPIHAPWSKVSEVLDFTVAVRAPRAFQIHDGLLNEIGVGMIENHVTRVGARYGTDFRHLAAKEAVEL